MDDLNKSLCSTTSQLEDFIKFSPVWKDLKLELKIWLSEIHMRLENLDSELSHQALDRLGGSAEAIRNLANLPETLLMNLKEDVKQEDVK